MNCSIGGRLVSFVFSTSSGQGFCHGQVVCGCVGLQGKTFYSYSGPLQSGELMGKVPEIIPELVVSHAGSRYLLKR